MATSLPFLEWFKPAAPADFALPAFQVQGVLLAAITFNGDDRAAFSAADLLVFELDRVRCSAIAHAMANANIFAVVYSDKFTFAKAVAESTVLDKNAIALRAANLSRMEAFTTAGAGPGPAELGYLLKVSWWSLLQEGSRLSASHPCELASQLLLLLGTRSRRNARADDGSSVRISSELFKAYVAGWSKLPAGSSDGAVASKVAPFLSAAHQRLLISMRTAPFSLEGARADLLDSYTLLTGRETEVHAVLWQRAAGSSWGLSLDALRPLVSNVAVYRAQMERLLGFYLASLSSKDPFVLLPDLERKLSDLGKHGEIVDLVAANADLSSVVTALISGSDVATLSVGGGGGAGTSSSTTVSTDGGGAGSSTLTARNIDAAISTKTFRDAVDDCKPLNGLDFVERNFRSGNALLVRYGATAPGFLRPRHPHFERFHAQLFARLPYFSYSLVLDAATGQVPDPLIDHLWDTNEMEHFIQGRWLSMDVPNLGFLPSRGAKNGTKYARVEESDFFIVESVLKGYNEFFDRLLTAVNYPVAPTSGHSLDECIEKQIEVVQYIEGLPPSERDTWYPWARDNFRDNAVGLAQANYVDYITSSQPSAAAYENYLPAGRDAFFKNIDSRLKKAAPITIVRQAFPSLWPSAPIHLPGTTPAAPLAPLLCGGGGGVGAGGGGGGGGGAAVVVAGGGGGGAGGGGGGAGKSKRLATDGKICAMLDSDTLFLAGRQLDIGKAAKEMKFDKSKHCFCVLCSNKEGDDLLKLCPEPDKHGGLNSTFHTPFKGFVRNEFSKKYSAPATAAQMLAVGWNDARKKKK